jgi:MMP 1-O-methyltransferase
VRFDETWLLPEQLNVLSALAQAASRLDGAVVEVGTWQGLSAVHLANAVHPKSLHVVDHWKGDDPAAVAKGQGIRPELVERDNYGIFLANMAEGTKGNFLVWKMDWRDFASRWSSPIAFLHLDATHTRSEVRDNIRALLPFAVPGGVFAGDDWDWPEVADGVRDCFDPERVTVMFNKMWWVNT